MGQVANMRPTHASAPEPLVDLMSLGIKTRSTDRSRQPAPLFLGYSAAAQAADAGAKDCRALRSSFASDCFQDRRQDKAGNSFPKHVHAR